MTPLEVCQIYQTIAAGGFFTGLRAIDSVMDSQGGLLNRYGLAVMQRIEPEPAFLLTHALQRVVSEGTAADLLSSSLRRHHIAGKTGTTDNLRDSWFVGFSGDHLGVVWIGRDDNGVTGLTGASGALRVWRAMMEEIATSPLQPVAPETIAWITRETLGGTGGKTAPLPRIAANPAVNGETAVPPAAEPSFLDTIGGWFKVWQ
jgi:penicillin-binding protein 1B